MFDRIKFDVNIVRFAVDRETRYGILNGDLIEVIEGELAGSLNPCRQIYPLNQVKLLAPCIPSKIVCLGYNYRPHADELSASPPDTPLIFLKPPSALIGPEDDIVYHSSLTRVDYEGELAVVIKKTARRVSAAQAPDYILGYTCFNDVTARDLQNTDKLWTRAKGFDTFAAIGPTIQTELDPENAEVETRLNGEVRQHCNTRELIYPVMELLSFISDIMTLMPGDIIATGTPVGIGPMYPGDTVEVEIEEIGTLRNHVVEDTA